MDSFGDVHIDIKPQPRGAGFEFNDTITGGVVPKQYIPSVESGVRDYLKRGPLGFQVVDIMVTLTDGQYHAVDSSDIGVQGGRSAGYARRHAAVRPVLLEPIMKVDISVPTEFTSKVQRLVSGRRGQLLGFDAKPGWNGWDEVSPRKIPQSETADLINELRSLTLGVGFFTSEFDHLQELSGKLADDVVAARAEQDDLTGTHPVAQCEGPHPRVRPFSRFGRKRPAEGDVEEHHHTRPMTRPMVPWFS